MTSKSKAKGNRFESQLVKLCEEAGLKAVRAWGSNGRALGHAEEVDLLIEGRWKVQAKKRAKLPNYLKEWLTNVDCCVMASDREEPLVLMPMSKFLPLLKSSL